MRARDPSRVREPFKISARLRCPMDTNVAFQLGQAGFPAPVKATLQRYPIASLSENSLRKITFEKTS